ncbi:hypothetical protein ACHWQZ_G015697 [Mnemiopsis leidyi]
MNNSIGRTDFKSQCSSCLGWSYSQKNSINCTLCERPVHKKCLKGELGCLKCCISTIPGYLVTSYELNDSFNKRVAHYFNPYDRSAIINQIGDKTDENLLLETNHFNEISDILASCKYQQPTNVKTANKCELKVLSLNIRSLSKNMSYFKEEKEFFTKFDLLCLNETNCCSSKLPNGMRDLEIDGFFEPIVQEPVRKSGKGGGLAIYINKRLCNAHDFESIDLKLDIQDNSGEFQVLKIHNVKNTSKTVVIVNFYRSPSSNARKFIEKLDSILLRLERHSKKLIAFYGDANIDLIKYDKDAIGQELIGMLEKYGFVQTVSKPTRVTDHSATLIDHVYTNHVSNVVSCNVVTLDISDHLAISTNIRLTAHSSINFRRQSKKYSDQANQETRVFNEANHEKFRELINNESWESIAAQSGANEQYNAFYDTYMKHYNNAYPLKLHKVRRKYERADPKPWILPWLEAACNRKNLLYFEKVKNPSQKNCLIYDKMKKFCEKHVNLAKEKHYKKLFVKYQDCSKKQWQVINSLLNRSKKTTDRIRLKDAEGSIISSDKAVADRFNSYFSSIAANIKTQIAARRTFDPGGFKQYLKSPCSESIFLKPTSWHEVHDIAQRLKNKSTLDCKIEPLKIAITSQKFTETFAKVINSSFSSGIFPSALKSAKVIPIHKGGSKLEVSNYRPISLLGSFSKIYEKLMHGRVLDFLDKNNSLFENQYGFRPGRSCEHALLNAQYSILQSLNKNQISLLLLLDYSKAFDVLDHSTLLYKLDHYGIRGIAKEWFESYLTNRNQFVSINGNCSESKQIEYGVPQGSILGPLLFVIYINDLPGICNLAKFILYADDANIIVTGSSMEKISRRVNQLISSLVEWVGANGLSLNVKKTCYMIFSRARLDLNNFTISIDNTILERKTSARFLGVIVDEKLSWAEHIKAVKVKMTRYIGIMHKIKGYLPVTARLQIFQSLVQSHLNFCSLVWGFASKSHIESLFIKQKQAMRTVMSGYVNYKYRDGRPPDHTKQSFEKHNVLTVHNVIVKNALTLMHKVKNMPGLLPNSIKALFSVNIPITNSTYENCEEWLSTYNTPTFRQSIFYKGPMLSITEHSNTITIPSSLFSINIFKNSAKRELIKLQSAGNDENWPTFLLYDIPGLRKSPRENGQAIDYYFEANQF